MAQTVSALDEAIAHLDSLIAKLQSLPPPPPPTTAVIVPPVVEVFFTYPLSASSSSSSFSSHSLSDMNGFWDRSCRL
jgi:hypothetical protein